MAVSERVDHKSEHSDRHSGEGNDGQADGVGAHQGPVRLVLANGERFLAWWWSAEMSALFFGPGEYRAGWFMCANSHVEIEDPLGWEPM